MCALTVGEGLFLALPASFWLLFKYMKLLNLRILIYVVKYDSGYVSLEHLSLPQPLDGNVTESLQYTALTLISSGNLSFNERLVVHRVIGGCACRPAVCVFEQPRIR